MKVYAVQKPKESVIYENWEEDWEKRKVKRKYYEITFKVEGINNSLKASFFFQGKPEERIELGKLQFNRMFYIWSEDNYMPIDRDGSTPNGKLPLPEKIQEEIALKVLEMSRIRIAFNKFPKD